MPKKIAFISLLVIIVVLAAATIVEKYSGTETALTSIYNAWWFVALWGICAVAALLSFLRKQEIAFGVSQSPQSRRLQFKPAMTKSALLLHIAFLLILAGAFTSFLTSKRGLVHIRQGEILNYFLIEGNNGETTRESLPFNVKLLMFSKTPLTLENAGEGRDGARPVSTKKGDFFSYLQIDGQTCCVWLNHIYKYKNYRFYQYEYDSDEMGVTLLVNRDPYGIAITYAGYLLLLVSALWLLWKKRIIVGARRALPLLPVIVIPTAIVWFFISQIKPMTPVLRSPMLAAHVSVILISYILLLIIAILSLIALLKKSKQTHCSLFNLNCTLLCPAVFLLAIGIFTGAVWANISWGRYWGWDAKETWALITLLVYALPSHRTSLPVFRSARRFHWYCVLAFFAILMTFFGVSYFLGGIHSYV